MFSNQVHLPQPVLKLHRIRGNVFPAYFNDVLSWPQVRCVIYWMVFKAQCSHSTVFHSTVHTSPYSAAQCSVCWSSFEMCVFPLYLSFEWSYDPDGTTALCMELSQEVSDGVCGKHTPGLHTSAHTYPYRWLGACCVQTHSSLSSCLYPNSIGFYK